MIYRWHNTKTISTIGCIAVLIVIATNKLCFGQKLAALNTANSTRAVDNFPVPAHNEHTQFYLQRTTDANTIMYDLNIKNGQLNEQEPIKIYWIRYTEKGVIQRLSYLQNKYAFGIESKKIGTDAYQLTFVSYSKVPLYLKKQNNHSYKTTVILDGAEIELQRLYLHIEPGGNFWSPNITYIEFKGKDHNTGKVVMKRIKPKP